MTDQSQKNDDGGDAKDQSDQASAQTGDQGDPEKGFWDRLGKTVEERVDAVVEKRLRGMSAGKPETGTTRGGGRNPNLPEIIADFMFGKQKQQ